MEIKTCKELISFIKKNKLNNAGLYVCYSDGVDANAADIIDVGIETDDGNIVFNIGNYKSKNRDRNLLLKELEKKGTEYVDDLLNTTILDKVYYSKKFVKELMITAYIKGCADGY